MQFAGLVRKLIQCRNRAVNNKGDSPAVIYLGRLSPCKCVLCGGDDALAGNGRAGDGADISAVVFEHILCDRVKRPCADFGRFAMLNDIDFCNAVLPTVTETVRPSSQPEPVPV